MKVFKLITVFSLIFLPFYLASNVNATESTPSPKPAIKREQIKARIEEKVTERTEKLNAVRKERVLNFSNKMVVRFESVVARIEKLISRIETRISKIEDEEESDIRVEPIKQSVDEAKQKLALVKIKISSLKTDIEVMVESDEPKTAFENVKTAVDEIRDGLKEVHTLLVKVIGDIKGLRVGENSNEE